jgi:hypothetical protein
MADAQDLKSWDCKKSCGFESRLRHQLGNICCVDTLSRKAPALSARNLLTAVPSRDDSLQSCDLGNSALTHIKEFPTK